MKEINMKIRTSWTRFALTAALLMVGIVAQAQVTLSLFPATVTIAPGGEATFNGSITNSTAADIFLNQMAFTFSPPAGGSNFTEDTSVFFGNVPGILSPGQTYTGPIFGLISLPSTPVGPYNGTAFVQGGADPAETFNQGSANFTVLVSSAQATPEPSAVAVVGAGFMGGLIGLRKLRRRR